MLDSRDVEKDIFFEGTTENCFTFEYFVIGNILGVDAQRVKTCNAK